MRGGETFAAACCGLIIGCGGGAPSIAEAPAPTAAPSAAAPPHLSVEDWGVFRSRRFDLSVGLPNGATWRIDDTRDGWLWAKHPATLSTLRVRSWADALRSNRVTCEQRARLWSGDLPAPDEAQLVEERAIPVPPGFDTVMRVYVEAEGAGAKVGGGVIAFGGWARQCFAFVYQTEVEGRGAEQELAHRLAVMVEVLDQIEFRSDTDPDLSR